MGPPESHGRLCLTDSSPGSPGFSSETFGSIAPGYSAPRDRKSPEEIWNQTRPRGVFIVWIQRGRRWSREQGEVVCLFR